jgi:hypothetical protein
MPKNSPNPPQTPAINRLRLDLRSLFLVSVMISFHLVSYKIIRTIAVKVADFFETVLDLEINRWLLN